MNTITTGNPVKYSIFNKCNVRIYVHVLQLTNKQIRLSYTFIGLVFRLIKSLINALFFWT
jgi:hypothetical protein